MDISKKKISSAIGLSREGLLGKACQALVSPGVAPNTPEVWDLLQQKHPTGPHPSLPISSSPPVNHVLPHDFNILSVLHSFPKGTACGPSGLCIQHLLDAAQVHLPTSICSSLRGVVNILASGKAPVLVSKFLAGGSLTAIVKNKEGRPLDIRPIAVGEVLRRLTGKCLCIITKPKASEFFNMELLALLGQKRSFMVLGAASRNIGKMINLLSARWICQTHSTWCLVRFSWRNVQSISQSFFPG